MDEETDARFTAVDTGLSLIGEALGAQTEAIKSLDQTIKDATEGSDENPTADALRELAAAINAMPGHLITAAKTIAKEAAEAALTGC